MRRVDAGTNGGRRNAGLLHCRTEPGQSPRGSSRGRDRKSPPGRRCGDLCAFARRAPLHGQGGHYRGRGRTGLTHLHGQDPGSQSRTGAACRHGGGSPHLRARQDQVVDHPRRGGRARPTGRAQCLRLLPRTASVFMAAGSRLATPVGKEVEIRSGLRGERTGCRRRPAETPGGQPGGDRGRWHDEPGARLASAIRK